MLKSYIGQKKIFAFNSKDEFLSSIKTYKGILIALNAEKLNNENEKLTKIINKNLGYPDGIGAVLALKMKGINSIKIAGAEFWLDIIKRYNKEKSFYIVGSSEEVINKTVTKLKTDFPGLSILGYKNGYLNESDKLELFEDVSAKKPDVIFIAQGSPRQELLMDELDKTHSALYMGLGGSLDVYCGLKKRAPKIFIMFGFEWFYRFLKEPSRFKRNLNVVKFIFKLFSRKL